MSKNQEMQRSFHSEISPGAEPVYSELQGDKILMSLLEQYGEQLAESLVLLGAALEICDFAAARSICHQARGSARTYGYRDLTIHLETIESSACDGFPPGELKLLMRSVLRLADRIQHGIVITMLKNGHPP